MNEKRAQSVASTVGDLYAALMADPSLSWAERERLVAKVGETLAGVSASTPLNSVLWLLSGAGLGALVSKYLLGRGTFGTVLGGLLGAGLADSARKRSRHVSDLYEAMNMG